MAASGRQLSIYKRGFAEALGAADNGLTFASMGPRSSIVSYRFSE
jgi:hypothetical protein